MKRLGFVAAVYLGLVFASGVVVGAFGYRLYAGRSVAASAPGSPEEFRRRYVAEMRSRLHLNDDQAARLETILDSTRDDYRGFREKHKPELQSIQDNQVHKINSILSNDQRAEYDRMREERERRRKERRQ